MVKDLAPQSHKKIVAVCEECGNVRVVPLQRYVLQKHPELCQSCMYQSPDRAAKIIAVHTGREISDETRAKMSVSHTGRKATPETLERMRIGHTGITHTQETKDKIRDAHKGKHLSDEHRAKMSAAFKGREISLEWREKMSASHMGHKVTIEARAKLRDAHIGMKATEETKAKMSIAQSGENNGFYGKTHTIETIAKVSGSNHYNWKGGIAPVMERIRWSRSYKNWRTSVFERDDYTCQMCNIRGGYMQAHHIEPVRDNKNSLLIFDTDNGITLCKKCHDLTKGKEYEFVEYFKNILNKHPS